MTTTIRQSLGRYHVEAEIGRGAMGVVYRARDPNIDRAVAIKTISLAGIEESEEQEYRDRFAQEARAAGKLAHPGIVTIFDAGEDPDTHEPFFVMEYVSGRPLSEEIASAGGRLPVAKALQFACQIADALHYAHSQGVIHGDIKPSNILVTSEGRAKIADFGVARLNQSVATHAGKIFGSPAYMAPEQLNGAEADVGSDLFSLGVTLYNMLTGFRPFQGNSSRTVCFKVMNVEPLPVSSLQADLPPELDRIVQRAIAKDPKERYQSGTEFANDLRAFIADENSFAEATRFFTRVLEQDPAGIQPTRARSPFLTRRLGVEVAIAVLLITFLFTGVDFIGKYRESATSIPPVIAPPRAPEIQKTSPEQPVIAKRAAARRTPTPQLLPSRFRIEILHHFASGQATVFVDKKLVLDQELRESNQGRGLFRTVFMNQTSELQFAPGKHELQVRVVSPGTYDQTETISLNLAPGSRDALYVNCDKKKLHLSLQQGDSRPAPKFAAIH